MIKVIGRVLLSLSIIAGVSLPVAPGVISVANAADEVAAPAPADTTAPTVSNGALAYTGYAPIIPTSGAAGASISVRFVAADNIGIATTSVRLINPGNVVVTSASGTFVAGGVTDGAYSATLATASSGPRSGDVYQIQAQAIDAAGNSSGWLNLGSYTISGPSPGLTPTFGPRVPDYYAPGFKHQISNYDPAYTWTVSASVGTATISSSGLISVASVGAKINSTVTVTTNRTGYNSASASVTSVGPWNLSDEIQAQNITATLSGTTLTVNVPDNRGWRWGVIWSGAVQRTDIRTFPYTITNFTPNREIQLYADDSLMNYGYSRVFLPNLPQRIAQSPLLGILPADQSVGGGAALSSSGGSGTGAVTFSSTTPAVCTVSGSTVTSIGTGTCSIVTTKAADSTYLAASSTGSFPVYAVNLMLQQRLFVSISSSLRVGSTATLSTSGGSGTGQVTYSSLSASRCTVSGNVVTAIAVGTCTIMATKAMDFTYMDTAATLNVQISGTQVNQLSISPVVPSFLGVGTLANLSSSGGSGTGAVTFTSQTTSICTVSGAVVRAIAPGNCTIYVTKAADSMYFARTGATSFTVTRSLISQDTIVIGGPISLAAGRTATFTYSGGSGTGAITTSSNTPSVCSVSGTSVTGIQAGTCQIVVSKGADSTYSTLSAVRSFTITTASLLSQASVFFISLPSNLSVNSTGTFQVGGGSGVGAFSYSTSTPSICSVSGTQVRGLATGTCTLVATKAADTTYLVATTSINLAIGKTAQAPLSFSPPSSLRNGSSVTLSASGGSGSGVFNFTTSTPSICSISGSTLTGIANGSCIVTATKLADADFSDIRLAATVTVQGLLTQAELVLSIPDMTNGVIKVGVNYGVLVAGGTGTGSITYSTSTPSTCELAGTPRTMFSFQIKGMAPGNCVVTVRNSADSTYSEATVTRSYNVVTTLKNQLPINVEQIAPVLVGESAEIKASGGSGTGAFAYSSLNTNICTVAGANVYTRAPGTCSISIRKDADSEFLVNTVAFSFTVRAGKPTVTFSPAMTAGQSYVGSFYVSANGNVSSGSTARIAQVCLTVDGSPITRGEVSNSNGYYWSNGYSSSSNCFNVSNSYYSNNSYRWLLESRNFEPGAHVFGITIIDTEGNRSDSASISIITKSTKPTIQVLSPSMGSVAKGKINVSFSVTTSAEAGRYIRYIGISEENAVPTFSGAYGTWSSPFSSGIKAFSVGSSSSSGTYSFQVNTQKLQKGLRTIKVAVQDSYGDVVEATVGVDVQALQPTVQILSPSSGQTFEGVVSVKVQASPDPSSTGGEISYIGIDNSQLTPEFAGVEQNSSAAGFPSNYRTWLVKDVRNFTFTATPGSLKNGLIRLTVLIADDTKASATASVDFTVSTANPTAVIISPVAGTIMPGVITLTAETKPNPISGGRIVAIAISEKNAQATFYGSPVFNSNNPNISRNYLVWTVDDVQKPSWKIDTAGWDPGDHIITVVTQDSYGKVGQGTVVLNVPPKGTFTSTLAGPPVLGRSVPISVEMKTNAPYRTAPAVVVTLQSSPTEAGPWKDLGDITLDGTGKGSGSVVVTAKLWVRALHKQLDAVQPGVGAPLRIVNVPDPNRTNTTSGDENPDGSTPKVTCVPKANTKVGKAVSISCSQIDVQDPSQPMTLFVQQKNKFVKANSAMFKDGFIKSSYASKSKGKLTFQVRGLAPEESNYVAWKSNMFTISWS